jgi:hypothetical protein
MSDEGQNIATLVHSDEYAKNPNQVASLSTHRLVYVKRKELALIPFELLQFPASQCTSITYEVKWAIVPMILGAFLVALVLLILSSDVMVGTRVPVGALAIALIFGAILARGPKRHRLTFLVNGKPLRWQSKAGDFKYKVASVQRVIAYAKESGLYREIHR